MKVFNRIKATVVGVGGLTLLLSGPMVSAQQYYRDYSNDQAASRMTMTGRVTSVEPERDGYTVYLDRGDYSYFVPTAVLGSRGLRVGADVRIGGVINGNYVTADVFALPGERLYTTDPYYRGTPVVNEGGFVTGTVVNMNHHLGYLDVRNDANGDIVRVDVRNNMTRHSVGVWDLRRGDHITVRGAWEREGVFEARRVDY